MTIEGPPSPASSSPGAERSPGPDPETVRRLSRRAFLGRMAAAGVATTAGGLLVASRLSSSSGPPAAASGRLGARSGAGGGSSATSLSSRADGAPGAERAGRILPGAIADRVLVVVDLRGGNDGLSTLVPAGDARYHDLRPRLAVPDDEVLGLDDEVGLHPSLGRLHRRGITTVEGVGPIDGDLSHFAMTERWERGDAAGTGTMRTGFLGRLADALDDGGPLVGVSLAGPTPHLVDVVASTMSLSSPDDLGFLRPDDWADATVYQGALRTFADEDPLVTLVAAGYADLLGLATRLTDNDDDEEIDWDDPMLSEGGDLGRELWLAADLIAADLGTRVVYVAAGDYDTHDDHQWRQADNLAQLDAAVDGFLGRVDALGVADRVLVATISEFGRRVPENGSGLDHGSASTMLVAGPVADRRLGDRPALDDLDADDNLRATVGFDRYLGSLAQEWLGVEAASVLPGDPEPLGLI